MTRPTKECGNPLPDEAGVLAAIQTTVAAMMEFIENDADASLPRYTPPRRRG